MLRARQRIGKYRVVRRIGDGGFSSVYAAQDTIEGVTVALKVPHARILDVDARKALENEVKNAVRLDHPNILPPKNATIAGGHFVVAYPLGLESLADRLRRRLATRVALNFAGQALQAMAHAHQQRVIHCDLKPENFIIFPDNHLRLADFGISKVALRTVRASGSGTLGYVAPEQAMGRPSFRSDVFALGLLIHRMLSGALPEWPFERPLPGDAKIESRFGPALLEFLHRAMELEPKRRFADASEMLAAWRRLQSHLKTHGEPGNGQGKRVENGGWRAQRLREFEAEFGRDLDLDAHCDHCSEKVSSCMANCPWCGHARKRPRRADLVSDCHCPRCRREVQSDWRFCAWCYGKKISENETQERADARYVDQCDSCSEPLFAFSRYCPWCRAKSNRKWPLASSRSHCPTCGWGVAEGYWHHCPWCSQAIEGG